MSLGVVFGIAVIGVLIGITVGAVGVGGVLLVPVLTLGLGIDIKRAIAAALLSYIPAGAVAVWLYARRGSIAWREAALLCVGILPAAWVGAQAASRSSAALLEAAIGVLLLGGGLYTLRRPRPGTGGRRVLTPGTLLIVGGVTGFGSALTGAGGAFILLPLLLLLDTPVLMAIGLGQAVVVPVAGVASIANFKAGFADYGLAAGLAATLGAGIAIGTPIAHALPQEKLRRVMGWIIVLAGAAMLLRMAVR